MAKEPTPPPTRSRVSDGTRRNLGVSPKPPNSAKPPAPAATATEEEGLAIDIHGNGAMT